MAFLKNNTGAIPGKPLKRKITPEEMRERKKNVVMKPGSVLLPGINKLTFSVFFILFLPFSHLLWGYFSL
jgi:hypothetical protein